MKNISKNEKCNHKWITFPTFKECSICKEIVLNPIFDNIEGIIDTDSLEESPKDEEEHKDVLL